MNLALSQCDSVEVCSKCRPSGWDPYQRVRVDRLENRSYLHIWTFHFCAHLADWWCRFLPFSLFADSTVLWQVTQGLLSLHPFLSFSPLVSVSRCRSILTPPARLCADPPLLPAIPASPSASSRLDVFQKWQKSCEPAGLSFIRLHWHPFVFPAVLEV